MLELLDMMRVRGAAYIAKSLSPPWGVHIDEHPGLARFHLVLAGTVWINAPGEASPQELHAGDLAIIPDGKAHTYADRADSPITVDASYPKDATKPYFIPFSDQSKDTHLLCGYFTISENTPPVILSRLPQLLVARAQSSRNGEQFDLIVRLAQIELSKPDGPSKMVLNRLTEMLCLMGLHEWLEDSVSHDEGLHALADPRTKLVLDAVHENPAQAWTVESLASIYGQSRTAFAEQFKLATGLSPIQYVRSWRVKLACQMLEGSNLPIDEIAFKSGYADTNAFNRAFRKEIGASPGAYRRVSRS